MRPAEPGRNALLDAGRAVLAERGLQGLSVNAVVARAGMAKGSFYTHFPDRTSFIDALYRAFHDSMATVWLAATQGLPPGPERLRAGSLAYFDACLGRPETVALLVEARFAGFEQVLSTQGTAMATILVEDVATIGWPSPATTLLLMTGAGREVALAEMAAGSPREDLRRTYFALVCADPSQADPPPGARRRPARRS